MRLVDVVKSTRAEKKYMALFCECDGKSVCKTKKRVHFGSAGSQTYLDHHDKKKREAYIARHRVNEDFNNRITAGALSRHLLWGDSTSLKENIKSFKQKFKC